MTSAKQLDQDLIWHACGQLRKKAHQLVREGAGPATAAWAAIRETKALFPHDWRLAVQGDDDDEYVEVWEVEHKWSGPCAQVSREPPAERPPKAKRSSKTRSSHAKKKRLAYNINPSSGEVVDAFIASGQPATYVGVQEFISARYGAWMRNIKRQYPDLDASEQWAGIQQELTDALERRGIHVEED